MRRQQELLAGWCQASRGAALPAPPRGSSREGRQPGMRAFGALPGLQNASEKFRQPEKFNPLPFFKVHFWIVFCCLLPVFPLGIPVFPRSWALSSTSTISVLFALFNTCYGSLPRNLIIFFPI